MQESNDPEGLRIFYYLIQDLKCLVFSLITLHFKVRFPPFDKKRLLQSLLVRLPLVGGHCISMITEVRRVCWGEECVAYPQLCHVGEDPP